MASTCVVLGDSMVSFIKFVNDTDVFAYRGAHLSDLISIIQNDPSVFASYSVMYLHIGTNDISNSSVDHILDLFETLVQTIQELYPTLTLILSSVLPRFVDFATTFEKVKLVNQRLSSFCAKTGVYFAPSYKFLMRKGHINQGLFHTDGLHLSNTGVQTFRGYICDRFASVGFKSTRALYGHTHSFRRPDFYSHTRDSTHVWVTIE